MALRVAVQMDPLESVNIDADSTLRSCSKPGAGATACWSTTLMP